MKKISTNITNSILETWNRDSFIILVEQREKTKLTSWRKVFREEIIPKFNGWESLSERQITVIIDKIGSEWKLSEYFYEKDYLHFLDNVVKEEDFKK